MLAALDPLKYDVKIMLWFLLVIIVILVGIVYFPREHFGLYGREIMNISLLGEDTCKPGYENDASYAIYKNQFNFVDQENSVFYVQENRIVVSSQESDSLIAVGLVEI